MMTILRALTAMLLVSCGLAPAVRAQMSELEGDRAHRDMAIHWPAAYDPSVTPVFSHNELLIHADCHRTFAKLTDALAWPNWLVIVKDVASETPGYTGQGALYRLKIFGSLYSHASSCSKRTGASAGSLLEPMRRRSGTATIMLSTSYPRRQAAL